MGLFHELAAKNPTLKHRLMVAHISKSPEVYIQEKFLTALMLSAGVGFSFFLFGAAFGTSPLISVVVFFIAFFLLYKLLMRSVDVAITKRAKAIDREVLFAGRFLLVKLNAGAPLMSAITEASKSYGIASSYFKEIVRDIELGTPIEEAIENASRYSPSQNFRKIIFQIANALRIGVDVTHFLEATLDDIADEQLIEISRYGKKLSGLTMFYMLVAIVVPSLGITLFITVISFLSIEIGPGLYGMILFMLALVIFVFMTIFKSSRPNVNI